MVWLIARQRGGLAALKLTKLFGIGDFPAAKDSGKVLIIIVYCYLIIIIIIIILLLLLYIPISLTASVSPSSPVFPSYLRYFSAGQLGVFNEFLKVWWTWQIHGDCTSISLNGIVIRVYDYYSPMSLYVYLRHLLCFRLIWDIWMPGTTWSSLNFLKYGGYDGYTETALPCLWMA